MANCSECTYLNADGEPDLYGRYWCDKKYERVSAHQAQCDRFCRAYGRSSNVSRSYEQYSKDNEGDPHYYLTTIVCNILKIDNDNPFLNYLRNFRDNTLQKNEKYKAILAEYDIVGPKIAKSLSKDPLRYQIAANALYKYIKPIIKLIKEDKIDEAVSMYIEMTNKLKEFYNITINVSIEEINNADITRSGHGIYMKKITN